MFYHFTIFIIKPVQFCSKLWLIKTLKIIVKQVLRTDKCTFTLFLIIIYELCPKKTMRSDSSHQLKIINAVQLEHRMRSNFFYASLFAYVSLPFYLCIYPSHNFVSIGRELTVCSFFTVTMYYLNPSVYLISPHSFNDATPSPLSSKLHQATKVNFSLRLSLPIPLNGICQSLL